MWQSERTPRIGSRVSSARNGWGLFVKPPIQPFRVKCLATWFAVPKFQAKVVRYILYSECLYILYIYIYILYMVYSYRDLPSIGVVPRVTFNSCMDPQDRHEWHWRWTQCGNSTSLWAGASWFNGPNLTASAVLLFMFIPIYAIWILFGMIMSIHKNWGWVETCWDNWAGMKLLFPGLALKLPALDCLGLKRTFQELVVEI